MCKHKFSILGKARTGWFWGCTECDLQWVSETHPLNKRSVGVIERLRLFIKRLGK